MKAIIGGMIRRSVRARFRRVYWIPPDPYPSDPCILAANHHGWHDGYVMFHVCAEFGLNPLAWVQEYEAFPLFRHVGALPYPVDDAQARASTIRRTAKLLKAGTHSIALFPEGKLHPPPDVWECGRGLDVLAKGAPNAALIPTGIVYDMSVHERPEAFVAFGPPLESGPNTAERTRQALVEVLTCLNRDIRENRGAFRVLVKGTDDVNERLDLRKFRKRP